MKADLVRKYLAPSPATPKGRMKRPRTGIRSTRTKEKSGDTIKETTVLGTSVNIIPMEEKEDSACHHWCRK
jgi:hypothetical protein